MSLKWYCYFSLNYICWDIPRFLVVLGVEVLWFVFCRWLTFLKLQIFHQMSSTFPRSESIGKYVENTNPRGKFWEHQKRITNMWDLFISRELIIKWTLLWAILGISLQHYVVHTSLSFDDATVFTLLGWKSEHPEDSYEIKSWGYSLPHRSNLHTVSSPRGESVCLWLRHNKGMVAVGWEAI